MKALLIAFALLQLADAYTTSRILKAGGVETNKLMRRLMEQIGVTEALVLTKTLAIVIVVMAFAAGHLPVWVLAALCAFYVLVVLNNVLVMRGRPSLIERLKKLRS